MKITLIKELKSITILFFSKCHTDLQTNETRPYSQSFARGDCNDVLT